MRMRHRMRSMVVSLLAVTTFVVASDARAEDGDAESARPVDGTAVRFYAPETGGAARPGFITHRVLAFQARLEAKAEDPANVGTQDRHVRAAVERLVVEGVLANLPLERAPDVRELGTLMSTLRAGLAERVGGEDVIDAAATAEGLERAEVDAIFARRVRASLYADRSLGSILYPSEEQLREVFRTAPHPFRGRRFEEVRPRLQSWYVDERLRVVEGAFLQAARSRIRIVSVRR